MARGKAAEIGTERTAANGYCYVKTEDRGWILKHWLVIEKVLKRKINPAKEIVRFKDGKKSNMDPSNIEVVEKGCTKPRRRIAQIEARLQELTAEKEYLEAQLVIDK